jgi:uncharacterized protein YyaL (SSP411 family)
MPNRLKDEISPYLLQHADNPVDWYPWGEEAFRKAREEDKPIFLSIGYSACHWCHVMERESFEDEHTAAILNEHFVSIKVDREERPDIDRIYMEAVQAMTGSGGWPMSVFLTPDGKPFYGGTYFPPTPRQGMPAFTEVLLAVANAWRDRRGEVEKTTQQVLKVLHADASEAAGTSERMAFNTLKAAVSALEDDYDHQHGGWGQPPKFPQPMTIDFLMRYNYTVDHPETLRMALHTLEKMARGGIYDQLGGGFHRYSVDERWLVPHFEKMLYDNALLARVYLHAWQMSRNDFYRIIAEETLDYVIREMTVAGGGFAASQDADTDGEEGKFYLWTADQISERLGDEATSFGAAYDVTPQGNFEGKNILHFVGSLDRRQAFSEARRQLFLARQDRTRPARDDKVLTSWNGLMLAAFAEASWVLDRQDYLDVARRNADFLLREMTREGFRLWHAWRDGKPQVEGFLEDYANLVEGLLTLYQADFDTRWYQAAEGLTKTMLEHFQGADGFYDTGDYHEKLITRPREIQDTATPSGNAMAVTVLLELGDLAMNQEYSNLATSLLQRMQPLMRQYPLGFSQWLSALVYAMSPTREIAIVGDPAHEQTRALLDVCRKGFRPHQVLAMSTPDGDGRSVPLSQNRPQVRGQATAYVCIESTCRPPVVDPIVLEALL